MASEGIVLNQPEECPIDLYSMSREQPHRSYKTPSQFDKLKQFIELDRKVLRFYCIWDDSDKMFGEIRPCVSNLFNVLTLLIYSNLIHLLLRFFLFSFSFYKVLG